MNWASSFEAVVGVVRPPGPRRARDPIRRESTVRNVVPHPPPEQRSTTVPILYIHLVLIVLAILLIELLIHCHCGSKVQIVGNQLHARLVELGPGGRAVRAQNEEGKKEAEEIVE